MFDRVQRAHLTECLNIADLEVLRQCAADIGLDVARWWFAGAGGRDGRCSCSRATRPGVERADTGCKPRGSENASMAPWPDDTSA